MASNDAEWDAMVEIARDLQQEYYELLPEWTIYEQKDYKYLKQNIGFALFGPPTKNQDTNATSGNDIVECKQGKVQDGNDIIETLDYRPEAKTIINQIFEKICELYEGNKLNNSICYGLIYNVTFRIKTESETTSTPKEEEKMVENKKEVQPGTTNIRPVPIFKIKKKIVKESEQNKKIIFTTDDIWYIDINCRVYKSWTDYKENNTLDMCTMVLPWDGLYQPDRAHDITQEYSVVWLEIIESPACAISARVLSGLDTLSNVVGIGGIGVGIASMFTPVGPALLAASAIGTGVNGLWTIGRSTQHLVDRNAHEESISPTDSSAFSAWLGITGSTVGLAASGGAALLSRAARSGSNISRAAQVAYNSAVFCNVSINGIGIGYQGYNMYTKYMRDGTVDPLDVVMLGTHVLFFGNAVMNLQFAGELINSSQGKVLDDYRSSIKSKRLRKQFNRAKRTAAAGNSDIISENAEVIRYINRKADLNAILRPNDVINSSTTNMNNSSKSSNANISSNLSNINDDNVTVNGVTLLDPKLYVRSIIRLGFFAAENISPSTDGNNTADDNTTVRLRRVLLNLLKQYFANDDFPSMERIPSVPDFEPILQDMKHMKDADVILQNIFKIVGSMMKKCDFIWDYLVDAVHFIWRYSKENLKQFHVNLRTTEMDSSSQALLLKIVITILEAIDRILDNLLSAFLTYITECRNLNSNNR